MAACAGCAGVAVGDVVAMCPAIVVVIACFDVFWVDGLTGGEETEPGGLWLWLLLLVCIGWAPARRVQLVVGVTSLAVVSPAASVVS